MKPESGMLTMELSSSELKFPIDAYTTLSQNLNSCSTGVMRADWLILKINEKAILITMPY